MAIAILKSLVVFVSRICKSITIEPVVALSLTAVGFSDIMRPNLLLDKACMQKLNYSREFCDNLTAGSVFGNGSVEFQDELEAVQRVVSDYESTYNLVAFVPRIFFALVAGPWSDRHGRKLLIAMPLLGQALTNAVWVLNYAFLYELPFEALYLELIYELCGTSVVYYMGLYCYMADITTVKTRSAKIAVIDGLDYVFSMVGVVICVPLCKAFNFYGVFGVGCALCAAAFAYTVFLVENVIVDSNDKEVVEDTESAKRDDSQQTSSSKSLRLSDLVDSFRTIFKERPEQFRRMIVLLLVGNFSLYVFVYNGSEGTHRYYFAMRKYGWDETEFSTYLIVFMAAHILMLWVVVPISGRLFSMHEATMTIICCAVSSIGQVLPAIFSPSWVFYASTALAAFSCQTSVATRTMASTAVGEKEVGRVYSVFGLMAAVSSSLMLAAYQQLYAATLESFAGAFLILNVAFLFISIPANLFFRKKLK